MEPRIARTLVPRALGALLVPATLTLATAPGVAGELIGAPDLPALGELSFVENLGQWDAGVRYVARAGRTVVAATEGRFEVGVLTSMRGSEEWELEADDRDGLLRPDAERRWARMAFTLEGAEGVRPVGVAQRQGTHDTLRGADPDGWILGARAFASVAWEDAWEGVDLRLRDGSGLPEYDLLLDPGADLSAVALRCEGVLGLEVDAGGRLLMRTPEGVLRQGRPVTWSVLPSGETAPVDCAFVVLGPDRFGFRLGAHDARLPVVVDPGLEWATYLGGSSDELIFDLARTPSGELVVLGMTWSADFPFGTQVPVQGDTFISLLDATGTTLLSSTVVGGTADDICSTVRVDDVGRIYVAGGTSSSSFPTTPDAWHQTHIDGSYDVYLMEFPPGMGAPTYSTFLGGSAFDHVGEITLGGDRQITLAGVTRSSNFPVTPATAIQPAKATADNVPDYYVLRIDLDLAPIVQYGTYLGGSDFEGMTQGTIGLRDPQLHEDAGGVLTLAGRTRSGDIVKSPTAWDVTNDSAGVGFDAYVARLDPAVPGLAGLLWDTYLGSAEDERARALGVEPGGAVVVGGETYSPTFPTTPGAYATTADLSVGASGPADGFVTRLDPGLSQAQQLTYSTFVGSDRHDTLLGLRLGPDGRVLAQGFTGQTGAVANGLPTTCDAVQGVFAGEWDGFYLVLDPVGNGPADLLHASYLGGSGNDRLYAKMVVASWTPTLRFVTGGYSVSGGIPVPAQWGFQSSPAGLKDGLVAQVAVARAAEVVRVGSPPNPAALLPGTTGPPLLGSTWAPVIDHTTFVPGALIDLLWVTGGQLNLPLPPHGTLLCDPTALVLGKLGVAGVPFLLPVPADCAFAGLQLTVQGGSTDGVSPVQLTNALDITVALF